MNKVIILLVFTLFLFSAGEVWAQCANININIEGTEGQSEMCPTPEGLLNESCFVGNTLTNPSYTVKTVTSNPMSHTTVVNIDFSEGNTTITAPNGSVISGESSIIYRESDSIDPGRMIDLFTITGGTGNFVDVSGELVIDYAFPPLGFTYTAVMKGKICFNVN